MSGSNHLKDGRRFTRPLSGASPFRSDESADTIEIDFSRNEKVTEPPPEDLHDASERVVQTMTSTVRPWSGPTPSEQTLTERQLHEQKQKVLRVVKRLADAEARAELVVETAPDAFVGVDVDGRILNWNAQATAIFGWTKRQALRKTLWDTVIPAAFYPDLQRCLRTFSECGEGPVVNHRLEMAARHREGHEFPVEVTISGPICTEAGNFFGAFLRDISQRKAREEELRKAKESAVSQARSLEILNGISRELSSLLNRDELLKRIGELLYQLIEYDSFSVLLLDSEGKNLEPVFSFTGMDVITKPPISIDRGVIGYAARTRQAVVVGDVTVDPRYIKFHEETRSELSVPLIVKDQLIGVLDIENTTPHYFTENHVQAMVILASQLAIALDNAMLYARVSAHERQLDQDLRFARQLQKRLLSDKLMPMTNAVVATFSSPARIIGGDIYEFSYYSKSSLHVGILGDVSGKGAAAALYAALTTGILRQLMEHELFPGEMLKRLNDALMERPLDSHFVALTYTVWDNENRKLFIANSGLPRPILYRNGKMSIIEVVGTPLGLLPGRDYDQLQIDCVPGDVLLFPTDGVLEALNKEGDEFGYEGVESSLDSCEENSPEGIKAALSEALSLHCEGVNRQDDQTLIVFQVT
ncbi:MAG TPA: SpoIIE family protein phosphatase [Pyrinomonadaceae bacterium]|nr:SpoIIE family protein phosphatase [Pyrinomonadaceae bacterium]